MRHTKLAALLATSLLGSLLSVAAPATAKPYSTVTESQSIETDHGHIYVEVTRPVEGDKAVRGPAVLTYSPYSALGRTNVAHEWVEDGYIAVFADVVGTGNSGGCYDYGGQREKETAAAVVEWIAEQPWSTGKVGMIGGSYNGTTANAAAVMAPKHLTTIVPELAISRWYGYSYSGGIRYTLNNEVPQDQGFDTPLAFDFGLAIPPPVDVTDPNWADKVASTIVPCDEIAHTEHGYDDTPDYDDFWIERDYLRDAKKVKVPVLVAGNWGDWNVKQEESYNWFKALSKRGKSPKTKTVLYMGGRYKGHEAIGGDYDKFVRQWMDHYLMGKRNGIDKAPAVISEQSNFFGHTRWYKGGIPKTKNHTLYAQMSSPMFVGDNPWKLMAHKYRPGFLPPSEAAWPIDAPNAESHANHHARSNHEWWYFESPAMAKDTRVFGEIKVQMYSKVFREWVTMMPAVLDVKHECHQMVGNQHVTTPECTTSTEPRPGRIVQSTTRGFLDSRYRNGLDKQVMVEPGKPFASTVTTKPLDYTFKKGHSIGLNLFTSNTEWALHKLPDPSAVQAAADGECSGQECLKFYVEWESNKIRLIVPIVGGPKNTNGLFDLGHQH
ncbi:MAG: CocE/NonD family hydrolase [Actinomycetota bacterium]